VKVSVTTEQGRHTLRFERRMRHPVEQVWRAISRAEHLSAWYPVQVKEIPLEVGAEVEFYDENGTVYPSVVSEYEPQRILAFRDAGGDEVRLELTAEGKETLLVFTHSFAEEVPPAQHATGWHACFEALDAVLDERPVPPLGYDKELRRHYDQILTS